MATKRMWLLGIDVAEDVARDHRTDCIAAAQDRRQRIAEMARHQIRNGGGFRRLPLAAKTEDDVAGGDHRDDRIVAGIGEAAAQFGARRRARPADAAQEGDVKRHGMRRYRPLFARLPDRTGNMWVPGSVTARSDHRQRRRSSIAPMTRPTSVPTIDPSHGRVLRRISQPTTSPATPPASSAGHPSTRMTTAQPSGESMIGPMSDRCYRLRFPRPTGLPGLPPKERGVGRWSCGNGNEIVLRASP